MTADNDTRRSRRQQRIALLASKGIDVASLTAERWLALAMEAEAIKFACSPLDPARERMSINERYYFEAAVLAEEMAHEAKEANHVPACP